MLKDKVVVIGVCGGIAAYKAADLVSKLKKLEAEVHVIMTKSACEFLKPLTFQSLSQNHVIHDMFQEPQTWDIEHISLAKKADLFAVVPATANIIGKVANGTADDMLSTTIMATKSPVLFVPAMNTNMFENPIVQRNIKTLQSGGYDFIGPQSGRLACGDVGLGKMVELHAIVDKIIHTIGYEKDLSGLNLVVTAGPTREPIDPVRFITNYSSGKMGYAIAKAAKYRGANVTLITGPTSMDPISDINMIRVQSAIEMHNAVMQYYEEASIIIKSAAVSDYRPETVNKNKIKKDKNLHIDLIKNPDILMELGKKIQKQVLIGFAMETEHLETHAQSKVLKKNLDFIVANDLTEQGAGFMTDTNVVKMIDRQGNIEAMPKMTKEELAHIILDKGLKIYQEK